MTTKEQFEKGKGDWEKLCNFMDENDFTCFDFLACICAHLRHKRKTEFKTEIMLHGINFKIEIKKEV